MNEIATSFGLTEKLVDKEIDPLPVSRVLYKNKTPFGVPVVPEVYENATMLSGFGGLSYSGGSLRKSK
jgi:hypothetical protein